MRSSELIERMGSTYTIRRFAASSKSHGKAVQGAEVFLEIQSQTQVSNFNGIPDAGELTVTFGEEVTDPIPVPGDLSQGGNIGAFVQGLQEELEALTGIGEDNIEVSATFSEGRLSLQFDFIGELFYQPLAVLTFQPNTMTEGGEVVSFRDNTFLILGVAPNTRQTITASVQTASPYAMQMLPEGQRTLQGLRIYTTFELKPASEQLEKKGDRILAYGREYEIQMVDPYPMETLLPHYRALATLVEVDNT